MTLVHALALAFLALVQDPATVAENETIVTAPRAETLATQSPALVTVISGDEIRRTEERSLPRALARTANLWVQETNLGGGSPQINGLIGNRILLVIDGVRFNDATTRNAHQTLNSIDPAIVDRIEVIRGPSSVLYGSDAMGGAVLIWTKRRSPTGENASEDAGALHSTLDLQYQTATQGGRGSLAMSGATADHGWLAIGTFQDWKDLRAGDNEEQDFTGYHGNGFFGSWNYAIDPVHELRASGLIDREFDVPRTDRLVTGFGQTQPSNSRWHYQLQDRSIWQLTYDDRSDGLLAESMEVRLSFRRYDEEREIQRLNATTLTAERDVVETAVLGIDWKSAVGDSHFLTWGIDLANDWVDSTRSNTNLTTGVTTPAEPAFAEDSRYTSGGVFVQDEISSFDPIAVTAGVRYSYFDFGFENFAANGGGHEDGNFGALTGSLSVAGDVGDRTRLTGTLSQGFRAPNLEDLANNGSFSGGDEIANPDLDPESNVTAYLALDVEREGWNGSLGVYFTLIEDLIGRRLTDVGDPGVTGDETYLRSNVGRGEVYGVDAWYRRVLGQLDSPWSLDVAASYARGRQYDDTIDALSGTALYDDVPFRRIPPLHGVVGLRWDDPAPGKKVDWGEVAFVWAATQNELNPEDESDPRIDPDGTAGWAVVDVDVGGPLGHARSTGGGATGAKWTLGLHNVLDENYRVHGSGIDAPGVSVVAGLRLSF